MWIMDPQKIYFEVVVSEKHSGVFLVATIKESNIPVSLQQKVFNTPTLQI